MLEFYKGIQRDILYLNGLYDFIGIENDINLIDERYFLRVYPDGIIIGIFDNEKTLNDFLDSNN